MVTATYSNDTESTDESKVITVTITDGAGTNGQGHINAVYRMLAQDMDLKTSNGWTKTYTLSHLRIMVKEEQDKEITLSEVEYIKNKRYHVRLNGRNINSDELLKIMNDFEKTDF
ncbi:hypothetical protein [Robiginitalea marina]|uniref:Uncharacterized protein n=1 Tax=Robiginitalea marina TaxID=2954105 RepID=A0ABT1AZ39_9FLAO|nr:hypothetical protein [Robiginitalea marina]MCO5725311.1 hypothetical protein [Robiginitalea marina]